MAGYSTRTETVIIVQVADLIEQCLLYEPLARPTASDVVNVLQRASSLVVWWGGRLHTVPEVSESGLQTGSSKTQSVSTATRTASRSSSQPLTQIQEAADVHLNEELAAIRAQLPPHPGPQEGTLLHIKRNPGDSISTCTSRDPSDVSTPDTYPSSNEFSAASEPADSRASSATNETKSSATAPCSPTETSLSAPQLSRGTPDLVPPEGALNEASTSSLIGTTLKSSDLELRHSSDAAEALLDSMQASRESRAATAAPRRKPPKSIHQPSKAPATPAEDLTAESQPSTALSALSDDSQGKENMAQQTFAELQQNPPVLFNSQFERMSRVDPMIGINQGKEPVASWERSSQADSKSMHNTPTTDEAAPGIHPLLNQTF